MRRRSTFAEKIDFYHLLSIQFPISPLRIVYSKSGKNPAAAIVRSDIAIIDHKLYWAATKSEDEALFLMSVLNSETTRAGAEQWQSEGQFGKRDFDKVMFNLPIPRFDTKNKLHNALAKAATEAEKAAAQIELAEDVKFQRARGQIRTALKEIRLSQRIDDLVTQLLDGG